MSVRPASTPTDLAGILYDATKKHQTIMKLDVFFEDELTDATKQSILSVAGLGIDDKMYTPIRDYPLRESAAHIIGYTGF